jgi:myo-inositol-1(or 4)-monophosphatase
MRPDLTFLETLARQAGEILRSGYGRSHKIGYKGAIDLVTEIDRESDAFLIGKIRQSFPDHSLITEESGALDGQQSSRWFVDPLDGTVNYAHHIPIFAVSIAYQEEGLVRLGVVYDPMRDECFSAERGAGARVNGEPIHVSETRTLNESLLVTGFPYDVRTNPMNNLDQFARLTMRSQGVRRLGSAALDLSYVGAGRFDAFWELSLGPWDVAAGGLIAEESGAIVTDMQGGSDYFSPPQSILASAPGIHAELLQALNEESA